MQDTIIGETISLKEFAEKKLDLLVGQTFDLDPLSALSERSLGRRPHELYQRRDMVTFEIVG